MPHGKEFCWGPSRWRPSPPPLRFACQEGQALFTDGPFAETKEQLAGYYILDCETLDEAIDWAARIPTACKGREGCVEIRPMPGVPKTFEAEVMAGRVVPRND